MFNSNTEAGRQGLLDQFLFISGLNSTQWGIVLFCSVIPVLLLVRYKLACLEYDKTYLLHSNETHLPPTFPHIIPGLGSAIPFAFDCLDFFSKATTFAGELVPVKISILFGNIFLFQGPSNVAEIWKHTELSSPIFIFTFGLTNLFGMPKRALGPYRADNSGSRSRPHPESHVAPHNRVDFLTHVDLNRAFGGNGSGPKSNKAFMRCIAVLNSNLSNLPIPKEHWIEMPDFFAFFQEQVGTALIQALYGASLLQINPGFMDDLWLFDRAAAKFAKLLPRLLMPKAYQARERLLQAIRCWYSHSRKHFHESAIAPDGDADPYWGSHLMRSRQQVLLSVDDQDDEAIAAADLGLIWTTITNVIPSSMMCLTHIIRDPQLRNRLRASLVDAVDTATGRVDMEKVLQQPLLLSVYAETLRLHTQVTITRCSPHSDVNIASWSLPKNQVCMVSTYASHMDKSFWNTRDGSFPLNSFWAERFVIDPSDPCSGPVRNDVPESIYKRPLRSETNSEPGEPFFSLKGLEGAWIPYGGGHAACPGRHLAKSMILHTTSLLLSTFDIELLTEEVDMDSSAFGVGTQKPKHPLQFRIRRR